jgi:hypothetical protein
MLIRIRLAILMPIQLRVWIPDWHQIMRSKCGSFPKFYTFWKIGTKLCYFYSQQWQLQNNSFHMSGKCVMILSILDSILKFSWKSKKIHVLGIDIDWLDPDRHALDTNPDPDPSKLCGSDPIRIQ